MKYVCAAQEVTAGMKNQPHSGPKISCRISWSSEICCFFNRVRMRCCKATHFHSVQFFILSLGNNLFWTLNRLRKKKTSPLQRSNNKTKLQMNELFIWMWYSKEITSCQLRHQQWPWVHTRLAWANMSIICMWLSMFILPPCHVPSHGGYRCLADHHHDCLKNVNVVGQKTVHTTQCCLVLLFLQFFSPTQKHLPAGTLLSRTQYCAFPAMAQVSKVIIQSYAFPAMAQVRKVINSKSPAETAKEQAHFFLKSRKYACWGISMALILCWLVCFTSPGQ